MRRKIRTPCRVFRDPDYAPCSFIVARRAPHRAYDYTADDKPGDGPALTILYQTDWDFPSLAGYLGHVPCECGATDGTVNCPHKTASQMISEAYDYLMCHLEETFDGSDLFNA